MECKKQKGAMPWLSWLVGFQPSPWRTRFNPRPAHVEFLGEVIFRVLQFSLNSIIPTTLYI